jgi:hypothetical protein
MLPPMIFIEQEYVEIGFSSARARIMVFISGKKKTLTLLTLMDNADVKTLCAMMSNLGGSDQETCISTRAKLLFNST